MAVAPALFVLCCRYFCLLEHDRGVKHALARGLLTRHEQVHFVFEPGSTYSSRMRDTSNGDPVSIRGHREETFSVVPGRADAGFVLFCDHAANELPPGYGTLGLPESELARHIGYDIGAAGITREIARSLGLPAIMSHYSRLLIDLNRGSDDPTLIMRISDGAVVPGNRHIDQAEREKRTALYYKPYHRAASALIDQCIAAGVPPAILSIHTYTPAWKGVPRPWHASVLWDKDPRLALALLDGLRADGSLIVGDNEPYTGRLKGDSMWTHGTTRGLAHAIVEVRQDLVVTEAGQSEWGGRLARIIEGLMGCQDMSPRLREIEFHGSHADI